MEQRFIVITPAKNEEQLLPLTIQSMMRQTIHPVAWIIVDDHSSDKTFQIAKQASEQYQWIHAIQSTTDHKRAPGAAVVQRFYDGYRAIQDQWEYHFIAKLDADLSFDINYFNRILAEFDHDPKLGIAGGNCLNRTGSGYKMEKTPRYHVRGATKIYRKACFDAIGGLVPVMGWDGLDEMKAQMLGWKTRSIDGLYFHHHRATGSATGGLRFAWLCGKSSHFMGYDPIFFTVRCVKNIGRKPYLLFSVIMLCSFFNASLRRFKRVNDPALIDFIRKYQRQRMLSLNF